MFFLVRCILTVSFTRDFRLQKEGENSNSEWRKVMKVIKNIQQIKFALEEKAVKLWTFHLSQDSWYKKNSNSFLLVNPSIFVFSCKTKTLESLPSLLINMWKSTCQTKQQKWRCKILLCRQYNFYRNQIVKLTRLSLALPAT